MKRDVIVAGSHSELIMMSLFKGLTKTGLKVKMFSVPQVAEDTVTRVVLRKCEETLQEVWERQSVEDPLQETPDGAQCTLRAYR